MKIQKLKCLLILLLFLSSLQAQTYIKGIVLENNNTPIENASIVIHDVHDNILAYSYSDTKGAFSIILKSKNDSDLKIAVNSLAFGSYDEIIKISSEKKEYTFLIKLSEKPLELKEVLLESHQKISSNGNVTKLKTKYFTDKTEQTVEDVLKKLPGVEVLDDGSIKAHGKFISKLLIDGDDVFANNYQILSKNLDAKTLDIVEIIDEFQDNPVLAKVLNSDMVALNLKLKGEFKNIWFGNIILGLGTQNRRKLSMNLGLLRKKIKFFYFGDHNNLGNKAATQLSSMPASINITSLYQEKQIEPNTEPIYTIKKNESNLFKDGQSTFNNAFLSSLGFVTKITPYIELRGLMSYTKDNQIQDFLAETTFNVNNDPVRITENSNTKHINSIGKGEIELKYTGGEKSYLKNTFLYQNQPEHFNNTILYNTTSNIFQNLKKKAYSFYNHLNYSYALGKRTILHNYVYLGKNKINQDADIESPPLNNLLSFSEDKHIDYFSSDNINTFGAETNLITDSGKLKYALKIGYEKQKERRFNEFKNETTLDTLENNLSFKTNKLNFKTNLTYSFSKKIKLTTGIEINHLNIYIDTQKKENWLFNPEIKLNLHNLNIGVFKFSYRNTFDIPKSTFFLENFQLNTYRSFVKGSDNIRFIKKDVYNFQYKWANKLESQAFTFYLKKEKNKQNYSFISQIEDNFISSTYGLFNGRDQILNTINFTSYFKKLNLSTNLRSTQSWSNTPFQINTLKFINLKNRFSSYSFSGTTYFDLPINLRFEATLNSNVSKFNTITSKTHWEHGSLDVTYKLSKKWLASLENDLYITENGSFYFLNFNVNYQPEDSNFSYRFIAKNLTNKKKFSNIIINDYSVFNSSIELIPRFFYLSVNYKF